MSNLTFGTISDFHRLSGDQPDMAGFRHLVTNKLKTVRDKLKAYSDETVICLDSTTGYWRTDVFPHYKGDRNRSDDTLDWKNVFKCFDEYKKELKEFFPVKVVEVDKAEGDDIIAVLAKRYSVHKPVCIYSSDKDLLQIQNDTNGKVKQFSMSKNGFITPANSNYDLFEHIVRAGDDGIPNILSDEDTFITPGKRQKPMYAKKVQEWKQYGIYEPERFCTDVTMLERFKRNQILVDLNMIPQDIQDQIVEAYEAAEPNSGKMFTYLQANRLNQILRLGGF